jgi:putative DNA primase/helicase
MDIPRELIERKQWVLWKMAEVDGRKTKLPISPWSGKLAACDKPQSWSNYRHCRFAATLFHCDGVGFIFTADDPFCGVDLDGCRTPDGIVAPDARRIIDRLNSYAEVSPSGTGVHIFVKAKLPGGGRRTGKIEVYDSGRYFTVSGKHLDGTPRKIMNRQKEIVELSAETFPLPSPFARSSPALAELSDDDLIERAKRARNGDRFTRLWAGSLSDYGNDHSRADAALCCMLAFWSDGDSDRIDRLFRRSGLMRDKWDRRASEMTYGAMTIRAIMCDR